MAQAPFSPEPRDNPFWTYRDPHTGRWVTVMTARQCGRVAQHVFMPRNSQMVNPEAIARDESAESET